MTPDTITLDPIDDELVRVVKMLQYAGCHMPIERIHMMAYILGRYRAIDNEAVCPEPETP